MLKTKRSEAAVLVVECMVGVMEYQASEPALNLSVVTFFFSAGQTACVSVHPIMDG